MNVDVTNSKSLSTIVPTSQVTLALLHLTQEMREEVLFLTQEGGRMEVVVLSLIREEERMGGGDLSQEAKGEKIVDI